jgi:hypothetical protein
VLRAIVRVEFPVVAVAKISVASAIVLKFLSAIKILVFQERKTKAGPFYQVLFTCVLSPRVASMSLASASSPELGVSLRP